MTPTTRIVVPELTLNLGDEALEALARRVAALIDARVEQPARDAPRYLSVSEAAAYLRCSRQRVYDLCSQGSLRRLKDGSRVLLDRAEIDAYLVDGSADRR